MRDPSKKYECAAVVLEQKYEYKRGEIYCFEVNALGDKYMLRFLHLTTPMRDHLVLAMRRFSVTSQSALLQTLISLH